jgi:hypothetical protein
MLSSHPCRRDVIHMKKVWRSLTCEVAATAGARLVDVISGLLFLVWGRKPIGPVTISYGSAIEQQACSRRPGEGNRTRCRKRSWVLS